MKESTVQALRYGQRVAIRGPFGTFDDEGIVHEVYDYGQGPQVVVLVQEAPPEPGSNNTVTTVVEADRVTPLAEGEPLPTSELPSWLAEAVARTRRYPNDLGQALQRVVGELPGRPRLEASVQAHLGPDESIVTDFVVHGPAGPILIQTEPAGEDFDADELTVRLLLMMVEDSQAAGGLLVTAGGLTDGAERLLATARIPWVRWRSADDDERLAAVLRALLERPRKPATG